MHRNLCSLKVDFVAEVGFERLSAGPRIFRGRDAAIASCLPHAERQV